MKLEHFFIGLFLTTLMGLGVVGQRVALVTAGYTVEEISLERDDLLDQHRVLNYNVLTLRSPVILNQRLAQFDVKLAPPRAVEIVHSRTGAVPDLAAANRIIPSVAHWLRQTFQTALAWMGEGRQAVAEPIPNEGA